MHRYIIQRLLQLIPILFGITFLTFSLMQFTQDDAVDHLYEQSGAAISEEVKDQKRAELGLDQPFLVQYGHWLKGAATGDMGRSYISGKRVFENFSEKLPMTVELMLVSIAMTLLIAIPFGILSAARQNTTLDLCVRFLTFIGNSLPNFFVALLLIYFLALKLNLFPIMGSRETPRASSCQR